MVFMKKVLYALAAFLLIWLVGNGTIGLGGTHHQPIPPHPGSDCTAQVIDDDGQPPPGISAPDPAEMCGALRQAEQDADCLGDWQPPDSDRVNARQFCLELQHRGCGDPHRDCAQIPDDQTYYTHH
jgi:hypothetical protein